VGWELGKDKLSPQIRIVPRMSILVGKTTPTLTLTLLLGVIFTQKLHVANCIRVRTCACSAARALETRG